MEYLVIRLCSAALVGMLLSQAGSLIQMSTRNILGSPSTLGFDGLSILWILLFHSVLVWTGIDVSGLMIFFVGVPFFILIAYFFTMTIRRFRSIEKLILVGITFNLFVGAIFSLWQFLFLAFNLPFPVELWFGHFRHAGLEALMVLGALEVLILWGWFILRQEFKLFSLGQTVSQNLKLNEKKLFTFIFIVISLGTFSVVSLFGAFSFLGLIFPIIARKSWFKKADLGGEFIFGALINGMFLMLIDYMCFEFPVFGAEVPVGLIATAVGAVSLILLLWKSDNRFEILVKR